MLDVRADGFVVRQHQHQFKAIARFILSHPIFYKIKFDGYRIVNSAFLKFF